MGANRRRARRIVGQVLDVDPDRYPDDVERVERALDAAETRGMERAAKVSDRVGRAGEPWNAGAWEVADQIRSLAKGKR